MDNKVYKILLVTGVITSEHDPKVNAMLRHILQSTGRFEVKITEEFRGATAETIEGYDAILINYDGKVDTESDMIPLGDTAVKTICDFVANGGGVIIFHSSVIAQDPLYPEEFIKMVGGDFKFTNGGRKNPKLAFRVDTVPGDPINEDLAPFWYTAQDDLFVNVQWLPDQNVEVLATVHDAIEDYDVSRMQKHIARMYESIDTSNLEGIDTDMPVIWKNTYGKGRVFVPFIGHGPDTLRRAEFVGVMARGCEWAASGEVTIPLPDIQEEHRTDAWPYYDAIPMSKLSRWMEGQ